MNILSFGITFLLLPSILLAAGLNDISNMLTLPLQWTQRELKLKTSSNCVANILGQSWIIGGKAIGVDNDISNTARKEQFSQTGYTTYINDQILQVPGAFPGQFVDSPGIFCTLGSQVAYGSFNGVPKACYLSGNDGTSNSPQCACCSVENDTPKVPCDDLDLLQICAPIFGSCVVNDYPRNRGIQIGGNTGTASVTNVLCFDIGTEQYTLGVNTISRLQAELDALDPRCEYGNLARGGFDMGCDMLPGDAQRTIVVVGGRTLGGTNTFLDVVQVCKGTYQNCFVLQFKLPQPASNVRVIGLTTCIFMAVGGQTATGPFAEVLIGDICQQKWLYQEPMPAQLTEFSLVVGVDVLCLYGGVISNQLQNIAYCTPFVPPLIPTTPKPTRRPTKPPTLKPSRKPTLAPTEAPTRAAIGTPQFPRGWKDVYQWDDGHHSQACYSRGNFLYVLGGKNNAQNTLSKMSVFDYFYNKWEFQLYLYNPSNPNQEMPPFHCPHSCSAGFLNRIYLVNPYFDTPFSSTPQFFECVIDPRTNSATCKDLCHPTFGILPFCASLIYQDACITAQDQFLFISGGRDGTNRVNSVTVFNMAKRVWTSVPKNSPAAVSFPTLYGNLPIAVSNHACATWNFNLFVLGGQTTGSAVSASIQKCVKNSTSCTVQNSILNIPRYYASAATVGNNIVLTCGAHNSETLTDVIEMYDVGIDAVTVDYSGQTPGLILDSPRRSCCLNRWDTQTSLVMTGGATLDLRQSIRTISAASYGIQSKDTSGKPLPQCVNIMLTSSNANFFGGFFYYATVRQYRVWVSNKYDSVIYYEVNNRDNTWVGNLSSQTWAYYPSSGFSSGYWTVLATKTTPQQSLYFTFDCLN